MDFRRFSTLIINLLVSVVVTALLLSSIPLSSLVRLSSDILFCGLFLSIDRRYHFRWETQ